MTQPLNYTPKAIEALLSYPCPNAPATVIGNRYIADKLREAQVFVLTDSGQLLDRAKPRPQVPGHMFKPPFPVVALEYTAATNDWNMGIYTQTRSSRRIALAWEWTDDLPAALKAWQPHNLNEGVVVASVCYHDEAEQWIVIPAAMHISYEDAWVKPPVASAYRDALIASGRIAKAVQRVDTSLSGTPLVLSPETVTAISAVQGGVDAAVDLLAADTMDEVNAYADLCLALACKNVTTHAHDAPKNLNRQRIKAGKLPLMGFHVLELRDGGDMPGASGASSSAARRSHLRRGHIRRLASDRVTWVNSAIVRGKGFVDKVYAAGGVR
jgi:hypothetical protein